MNDERELLIRQMAKVLKALVSAIDESDGVAGWHRNGDVASWDELDLNQEHAEDLIDEAENG